MSRGRTGYSALAVIGGIGLLLALILLIRFAHPYWTAVVFLLLQPIPIYVAGLFAYRKAQGHPTARRLLIAGSLYGLSLGCESVLGWRYASEGRFAGLWVLDLAAASFDIVALVFAVRLFSLFPNGRYARPYERVALGALWVVGLAPLVAVLGNPTLVFPGNVFPDVPRVVGPFAVSWLSPLASLAEGIYEGRVLLLWVSLVLLLLRYRRASYEERLQIKWVLYAVGLMVGLQVGANLLSLSGILSERTLTDVSPYLNAPILPVTLVAAVFAMFRHRALDIDLVIRRSVMYGALWLLIGAAYVGVASALGIAAGERLPVAFAIVLTVAVTLLFQPVHRRLERLAVRLVYGERPSRYELLTRFGETLEHAFDVGELAPRIATAIRDGLDLRWARVFLYLRDDALEPAGSAGIGLEEAAEPTVVVPLAHGGERLGAIECGPKAEGVLRPADHELLATIARQAALGIHNGRLAAELSARLDEIRRQAEELSASRARIVHAQDAERRRIERNIHDGVQQEIVALVAKLRLARNQLGRDPGLADASLSELQHEARQTLEDLRELARGIHPPVLTDRGLLDAVEERVSRLPLPAFIEADPGMRSVRFAGDVEAAAYFMVSEGLANALKHASSTRVRVRLARSGDRLVVEVSDDGVGFVPADASGSGLTGLRDRIEALGGTFRVRSRPGEGTALLGDLPAPVREPSRA
jgi:signal transduction histidine kinase